MSLSLLAGCTPKPPPAAPPPPKVTVGRAVPREVQDFREYTGWTDAVEAVDIRARVRGFLTRVYLGKEVREGTEVKKGTPLFEIEKDQYEADLARAEADVARAQFQLRLAESEVERTERLRDRGGAASEEEYQQRVASRDTAKATLKQARASEQTAKDNLNYTHVVAPWDGQVGRRMASEGNLVGFSDPTLLTTIVRTDFVYVWFDAPERDFLEYNELAKREGLPRAEDASVPFHVGLTTDEDTYPHQGVLNFRDNRVDRGTGTITLRGVLANGGRTLRPGLFGALEYFLEATLDPNPERVIKPGMFARVKVPFGRPKQRLTVPESALSTDQAGQYLLLVTKKDGKYVVERRPVKAGTVRDGWVAVVDGLKPEEWLITKGLQMARPTAEVDPQWPAESPGTPPAAEGG
jgi:RND family efflux transporter MFP subunit